MSLPGLGLEEPEEQSLGVFGPGSQSQTQTYELQKETEWRFEIAVGRSITLNAVAGRLEIFGTELVIGRPYTFTSTKAAVFTWEGCKFEITSDHGTLSTVLTSEYVAAETTALTQINVHYAIEGVRDQAKSMNAEGPRILIVGPENSGKTTLAKTLTGMAIRAGRGPLIVNLDPGEAILSLPGTLTATVFKTLIEVEEGWGNAPMSGPNGEIPVKIPLVYYYGSMVPEEKDGKIYKALLRQVGLAVFGKMDSDREVKVSGAFIDTPGTLVNARAASTGYDILAHIVSEFGVSDIFCLGSERLYSDLCKKFHGIRTSRRVVAGHEEELINVIKFPISGGVVDRDISYLRAIREAQVKTYFYGNQTIGAGISLQPRQQQVEFNTITVWRRINLLSDVKAMALRGSYFDESDEDEFLPGGATDDNDNDAAPKQSAVPLPADQVYERLTAPLPALRNCILAVMNCEPDPESGNERNVLRDSTVMGFLYVTDIDETRGRISLLSPVAGRVPNRALVWAEGVDGVLGIA